jgi:hypothetical protein
MKLTTGKRHKLEILANCPSVFYTCGVLTYTVGSPLCWVTRVLASDSGIITTLCLVPSDSLEESALGENSSCLLSLHDLPYVGPSAPLVSGYVSGPRPTSHMSGFRCYSWCRSMVPSHYILRGHIYSMVSSGEYSWLSSDRALSLLLGLWGWQVMDKDALCNLPTKILIWPTFRGRVNVPSPANAGWPRLAVRTDGDRVIRRIYVVQSADRAVLRGLNPRIGAPVIEPRPSCAQGLKPVHWCSGYWTLTHI